MPTASWDAPDTISILLTHTYIISLLTIRNICNYMLHITYSGLTDNMTDVMKYSSNFQYLVHTGINNDDTGISCVLKIK